MRRRGLSPHSHLAKKGTDPSFACGDWGDWPLIRMWRLGGLAPDSHQRQDDAALAADATAFVASVNDASANFRAIAIGATLVRVSDCVV